jgi:two-component system, OmpR family, sensor histidine kinase MtrB
VSQRPWGRLGLRARVTVTFGLGALLLSTAMATITYFTARQFFLREREDAILRQAYVNASLVRSTLRSTGVDVPQLLASLDTVPGSRSVLEEHGQWYATSISVDRFAIPASLRNLVVSGTPATQHFYLGTTPELVVGLPVPSVGAAYFEVFTLDELGRTLQILALALTGAAVVTTIGGTITGRWASGRALRPLAEVSRAAQQIAGGGLDTRLTPAEDPDLTLLAASFNEMADALQERIEREMRFTADVSHELRSPLTTASTALEVLQSHAEQIPPRSRQALALLTAELQRFRHMVDDLLEISRVDTGAAELSLDEVEVGELVHQAAATAGASSARVEVDPRVAGLHLLVDKRRIERVVANLVANAQQYAGGVTRVAVEPATSGVQIVVADHGPGVPVGERERIFERFYRGQAAGSRGDTQGSGLGLALVNEHVRLHGGRVWVESGADGENRFVVELPAGSWPEATPTAAETLGAPAATSPAGDEETQPGDGTESGDAKSSGDVTGAASATRRSSRT